MRVVFDTNIFISALVIPGSIAEKAILKILEGHDQLVISKAIINEVLQVLARKFSRDSENLSRVAVWLSDIGILVRPKRKIHVLEDEPDNRILECAVEGHAKAIVTGDKRMLELGRFQNISIISLREYLDL
ncbi:MAG: putative toxin-antitoxin system toxin component, PIN family [Deltaproteobacteria bacterium]|nr:MAG: putative toxin-antitoxin system toxin component, PIN family [Deltaproteobacteria bacterium]